MSGALSLGIMIAVLLGVLIWLLAGSSRNAGPSARRDPETEAAEDEVRNLDAFTSAEEAEEELPDWGPGAPKH
jgi:type IV secretory pathway TrbD component